MKWQDINFERAEWRIEETKNDTPQTVTLSPEAIEVLQNRKSDDSEFVFPGIGKSGHIQEPRKGWERILKSAEIKDLRLHDLRRTLGSCCLLYTSPSPRDRTRSRMPSSA